jgi:hypothetical protein
MKKLFIILCFLFLSSNTFAQVYFDPCVGGTCVERDFTSGYNGSESIPASYYAYGEAIPPNGTDGYYDVWSRPLSDCVYAYDRRKFISGTNPAQYTYTTIVSIASPTCPESACYSPSPASDADCDGLGDSQDPFPNDSAPFNFKHIISYYDATGTMTGFMIELEDGSTKLYGAFGGEGGSVELHPSNSPWLPSSGLVDILAGSGGGNFQITGDFVESIKTGDFPDTPINTGVSSDGNTTDTEHLADIVDNIQITNQNMQGLADRLKGIGKSLDDIKIQNAIAGSRSGSGTGTVSVDTTALEQKIDDLVAPEGDASYSSTTGGLVAQDTFEAKSETLGGRFGTRLNTFFTSVKASDLFSVPFGLFSGFTSGGVSTQTISIGKWGSLTDNMVSTDLSDYNAIWDVLKTVIMLMFAYASFKIVVTKHA